MKLNHLTIFLVAVAFEGGHSFVPSKFSCRPFPHTGIIGVSEARVSGPLFSSPQGDVPLDTKAIIAAYEEWRSKFGKGDFDIKRFHNFENNYRVLTAANIKARDKALAEGKPAPQWLELNEYGDYARDEYKTMVKTGETPPSTPVSVSPSTSRTQVISAPNSAAKTQLPTSQGTQVITPAPSSQPGKPSVKPKWRPPSQGQVASTQSWDNSPVSGLYGPPATTTSSRSFGTQVVRQNNQALTSSSGVPDSSISGLYGPPGSSASPSSGTKVAPQGTQVISAAPATGVGGWSPSTTNQSTPGGTQVISKSPPSSQLRSTQVIQKAPAPHGTQVIGAGAQPVIDNRGTYVIQPGSQGNGTPPRGTRVISQDSSKIVGELMNTASDFVASGRGTQVVQKATKQLSDMLEASGGSEMFRQVGAKASKSIFSLFGGQKSEEDPSRSVRGTVKIQGDNDGAAEKQTILVDMSQLQEKIPSIFSFFGGSRTEAVEEKAEEASAPVEVPRTSNAGSGRPTLVIDKNSVEFPGSEGLPELRRWWQGADGTVTGFIYNSKSFNDGTKLSSSKLQRASCKPGNILRSGGEDYILR